ncbi:type II toxin-antitoxin system HicA family toxin [Okeania sp. SIO3B5]|uniref:type II toxin-antitoxin system HicA family toxin n=1 Tax=Okeania sp. SIO3B5 TaxID=2607811 RepID=UPI0025EEDC17|nr:type II toxin-antitoxin system HicA family toxin [Okeania sp. SIO3B5]
MVLWEGWQDFATFEIVKKLKTFGFVFDRQAAGSHEIWYNPDRNLYTTIPNHSKDLPEGT